MRFPALIGFVLACLAGNAQLYDAQWVIGPTASLLDFQNDTITLRLLPNDIPFFLTSACICDENGKLLFTCYGSSITDGTGDTLLNGNNLSPCPYTTANPNGFGIRQAALFLPEPGNSRYYILIHFSLDTLNNTRPGTFYYSLIDKEGNSGLGAVIQKNIIFCKGIFRYGGMTACKHANGRDWWVIIGGSNNNEFYKFLFTPDSVLGPFIQTIGPVFSLPNDEAYSKFSQDGSKFVTGATEGDILVIDFDRCSGQFSNPVTIFNLARITPPTSGCSTVEFSPNNRFVYISDAINLTQYDLLAANIQDSVELYSADTAEISGIDFVQVGPNGKIYGSTWDGGFYFLHVINFPDDKGDSCEFVYGGQPTLSANSYNLPNMVNYSIGPLLGSACDTIIAGVKEATITRQLRIHPNPADKYIYCEMPMQGNFEFSLLSSTGQLIDKKQTPQVDIFDTEKLAAGMYFIIATDRLTGRQTAAQKIAVVH